jgi:hypothetical protein
MQQYHAQDSYEKPTGDLQIPKQFPCDNPSCNQILTVPKDLINELERGEEVALYCKNCRYLTIVEYKNIIACVPPRSSTRWTETFY